ncbi:2-amino-4-hydroxy-6-hydroxymethyldihydropteridine diphosphokinase [bacterium]|nr:2-amino-4-hydroxy-6-hydroxymethyldihydropteridine diphosphokinase [bacterium]
MDFGVETDIHHSGVIHHSYHPYPIILGLGGNLGPVREAFDQAIRLLGRLGVTVENRSRLYHARPWGVPDQPDYLNAAIAVRTRLRPLELLWLCLHVEATLGRRRRLRWGPRRIDVDLLLYGNLVMNHPRLKLPHPRIARRDFVLQPIMDLGIPPHHAIAPAGWGALLRALPSPERMIYHAESWSE